LAQIVAVGEVRFDTVCRGSHGGSQSAAHEEDGSGLMHAVAFALLLLLASACGDSAADAQCSTVKPGERVLFVGDSNMEAGYLKEEERFASIFAAATGATSINVALGGTQSRDWVPLANEWTDRARPELPADKMVVMLGSNDVFHSVSVTAYEANLADLIGGFDGGVYLLTPPPYFAFPKLVPQFGSANKKLAGTLKNVCGVIDTHEFLSIPEDYIDAGLHLNAQGQQKIADVLIKSMGGSE
jgi:lysophospholipase L1-like esterase